MRDSRVGYSSNPVSNQRDIKEFQNPHNVDAGKEPLMQLAFFFSDWVIPLNVLLNEAQSISN